YVLQEPVRRQIAPEPLAPRRLVGRGGDREKLGALDIAPLRKRDLVPGGAAADPAARHFGEADVFALARHLRRASAHPVRSPPRILRPRHVSQVLVGGGELGPPHGRGRRSQAQRPVEAAKRSRFARVGLNTFRCSILLTSSKASTCERAMPPEPRSPSVPQSSRAMRAVPMALSAATRRCCRVPSLMMASGSPVSTSVRNTRPQ